MLRETTAQLSGMICSAISRTCSGICTHGKLASVRNKQTGASCTDEARGKIYGGTVYPNTSSSSATEAQQPNLEVYSRYTREPKADNVFVC